MTYTFACKHNITLLMDAVRSFVPAKEGLDHLHKNHREMGVHGLATLVGTATLNGPVDLTVLVQLLAWQANKKILLVQDVQEAYKALMGKVEQHSAMKDQDFVITTVERTELAYAPGVSRQARKVRTDSRQYFQDL